MSGVKGKSGVYKRTKSHIEKVGKAHKLLWKNPEYRKKISGKNSVHWKGGKRICGGYIKIFQPSHPRADEKGYIRRSHLVMEKMIGRYLVPSEMVHHRGIKYPIKSIENSQDDRPENLQLFKTIGKHVGFHNSLRDKTKVQ